MRSEKEMLELIVSTAENNDRIRAVIMSGSRANPNARQDIFQYAGFCWHSRSRANLIGLYRRG